MPTKRYRVRAPVRPTLSEGVRAYFQTGDVYSGPGGTWLLEEIFARPTFPPLWEAYGAEIVDAWIRERPGDRPWAWWRYDAPEPRQIVAGHTRVIEEHHEWRERLGVPVVLEAPADVAVLVESSAAYLRRCGLLARGERRRLPRGAFLPSAVPDHWPTYRRVGAAGWRVIDPSEEEEFR